MNMVVNTDVRCVDVNFGVYQSIHSCAMKIYQYSSWG